MATTLEQYWTEEVARLDTRLTAQKAEVTARRNALSAAQTAQRNAAKAVQTESDNVAAARKALAAIPMPADGDPLLVAMEQALVALAAAEVALANADRDLLLATAELARTEKQLSSLDIARADAERQRVQEQKAGAARQVMIDKLNGGDLATIMADAIAALANEPTARARVESEFPTNAAASKSFLDRVRARRGVVRDALKNAEGVETAAFTADVSALAKAERDFAQAVAAVRTVTEAAPRLAADNATLTRLAALPAANPPNTYPILTRWQHDRLHDAAKKSAREDALAKLTAIDNAQVAVQTAQQAYDLALHTHMKTEPDKTQAELDAALAAELTALQGKRDDRQDKRDDMNNTERETVQTWFAAVPDKLWDELEKLDTARTRLGALAVAPTPGDLINTMQAAEVALTTALTNARATARQQDGADAALEHAAGELNAERETVNSRAQAYAHSAVSF